MAFGTDKYSRIVRVSSPAKIPELWIINNTGISIAGLRIHYNFNYSQQTEGNITPVLEPSIVTPNNTLQFRTVDKLADIDWVIYLFNHIDQLYDYKNEDLVIGRINAAISDAGVPPTFPNGQLQVYGIKRMAPIPVDDDYAYLGASYQYNVLLKINLGGGNNQFISISLIELLIEQGTNFTLLGDLFAPTQETYDNYYPLNSSEGGDGTTTNTPLNSRVNGQEVEVGYQFKPPIANNHYYEVIGAGTLAEVAPEYKTDGSSFADGTATIQDKGDTFTGDEYEHDYKTGGISHIQNNIFYGFTFIESYTEEKYTVQWIEYTYSEPNELKTWDDPDLIENDIFVGDYVTTVELELTTQHLAQLGQYNGNSVSISPLNLYETPQNQTAIYKGVATSISNHTDLLKNLNSYWKKTGDIETSLFQNNSLIFTDKNYILHDYDSCVTVTDENYTWLPWISGDDYVNVGDGNRYEDEPEEIERYFCLDVGNDQAVYPFTEYPQTVSDEIATVADSSVIDSTCYVNVKAYATQAKIVYGQALLDPLNKQISIDNVTTLEGIVNPLQADYSACTADPIEWCSNNGYGDIDCCDSYIKPLLDDYQASLNLATTLRDNHASLVDSYDEENPDPQIIEDIKELFEQFKYFHYNILINNFASMELVEKLVRGKSHIII